VHVETRHTSSQHERGQVHATIHNGPAEKMKGITVEWDYAHDLIDNHILAATAIARLYGIKCDWSGVCLDDSYWIFAPTLIVGVSFSTKEK